MVLSLYDRKFQIEDISDITKMSIDKVLDILRENGRV